MFCKPSFFGLKVLPELDINDSVLHALATETVNKGFTVPGVQKKLSICLEKGKGLRLTLVGYPTGYILKPQAEEYPYLPESEDLAMDMASVLGINVVPHGLIKMKNGQNAYITKRVDRIDSKKLAMEDFCQLSGRLTEDKYKGSYEQCAKIIKEYSSRPGFDLSEFFLRIVYCFVSGNSDMHLKNFSLIESENGSQNYVLSSAYDLLPVNLVNPADTEETALTMLGKKKNFKRDDFLEFAKNIGMEAKVAENMIKKVVSAERKFCELIEASELPEDMKESYTKLITKRTSELEKNKI